MPSQLFLLRVCFMMNIRRKEAPVSTERVPRVRDGGFSVKLVM